MKKYMGSKLDLYVALCLLLLVTIPLILLVLFLLNFPQRDIVAALIIVGFLLYGVVVCGWMIKRNHYRLFSVAEFDDKQVIIRTILKKPRTVKYNEFKHCGIAYYAHGVLNTSLGSTVRYVILTKGAFPSKYCERINQWKFDEETVRVGYSKELVEYLSDVLPRKLVFELKQYGDP